MYTRTQRELELMAAEQRSRRRLVGIVCAIGAALCLVAHPYTGVAIVGLVLFFTAGIYLLRN